MSSKRSSSLLDDTDRERGGADPEVGGVSGAGDDGDGTAYGTGNEGDDAYLSVNGGSGTHSRASSSGPSKLARCKDFVSSLSGKQWAIVGVIALVLVLIGLMAHHKPPHPPPHDPHAAAASAGAEIEVSSSVHHSGPGDHQTWNQEGGEPQQHHSEEVATHHASGGGEHETGAVHHEASGGGGEHHQTGAQQHHIGVVHEPELDVPSGFEEVEGEQSAAIPAEDDVAHADHLAEEHGADEEHHSQGAGGLHAPRIVHPHSAAGHSVHDSVAVLATGGDKPMGHPGDGHHGPHIAELKTPPHDLDVTAWSHVFEDVHSDVRWFHVLRDVHLWRVFGKWENGKGADEKGFHFTTWKPTDSEQVRHGLAIHRQWQPMNELALLTLRAVPAPISEHDAHHDHSHIVDDHPTIIGVGPARPSVEPPSAAHHETEGTHLEGGEPIVVLYTPAHWSHLQRELYAGRVLRVVERHQLPRRPVHHEGLIHHESAEQHHQPAEHHEAAAEHESSEHHAE